MFLFCIVFVYNYLFVFSDLVWICKITKSEPIDKILFCLWQLFLSPRQYFVHLRVRKYRFMMCL